MVSSYSIKHKREWDIKTPLKTPPKSGMWDNNQKKVERVSNHPSGVPLLQQFFSHLLRSFFCAYEE